MPRHKTIPRSASGLFLRVCPKCGKSREVRSYPQDPDALCPSCAQQGRIAYNRVTLSDEDIAAYKAGATATDLCQRRGIVAVNSVTRALRRQGVTVRDAAITNRMPAKREKVSKAQEEVWKRSPKRRAKLSEHMSTVWKARRKKRGGRPSTDAHHLQMLAEVKSRCSWDEVPAEMLRLFPKEQKSVEGWRTVL